MAANNMKEIKRRIRSVDSMGHITNAMKLVSAAKLRRARSTFDQTGIYLNEICEIIGNVFRKSGGEVPERYLSGREIRRSCYVIITGNRGLCGSFNSNIIKAAQKLMREEPRKKAPLIVAVGSRGRDFFKKRKLEIVAEYLGAPEGIGFSDVQGMLGAVMEKFNKDEIQEIVFFQTRFVNALSQQVEVKTVLPFAELPKAIQAEGEAPSASREIALETEFEPSPVAVLSYMIPKYMEISLYGAVIESAVCEHAARRIAMENASDNASSMISALNLSFNRTRQAAITKEITEIVSGSEALS